MKEVEKGKTNSTHSGDEKCMQNFIVIKPREKLLHVRSRCRWGGGIILKWILETGGYVGVDWTQLAHNRESIIFSRRTLIYGHSGDAPLICCSFSEWCHLSNMMNLSQDLTNSTDYDIIHKIQNLKMGI
jgi:hypothetical protein